MSTARAVQAPADRRSAAPTRRGEQPRRPQLRIVDPATLRRPHIGRLGTIVAGSLFAALFALAGLQTMIINSQAHLDEVNKRIAAEQERGRDLRLQLADLQSPQRITAAASERLGMVAPAGIGYLQPAATDEAKARYDESTTPTTVATPATTVPKATTTPKTPTPTTPKTTSPKTGTTPTTAKSPPTTTKTANTPATTARTGTTR